MKGDNGAQFLTAILVTCGVLLAFQIVIEWIERKRK